MRKQVLITFCFLFFTIYSNAQVLYLQENYKGGISVDGKSYYGQNYLASDTINFVNTVPVGSTIKKALLLSLRFPFGASAHDNLTQVIFNNQTLVIDSSNIATPVFYEYGLLSNEQDWITVNDVTPYAQSSNNQLITPCQGCSVTTHTTNEYVYAGFLLIILYENNSMPTTNVALFLNNQNLNTNMNFNLLGLNSIDNTKDAGLSIWTDNLNFEYPINFILNSTIGNFNLGNLWFNESYLTLPTSELLAPGSFYYQNNTLFGLQDDSPNPFIDSTDALANIKTYVGSGATSFSLSAATINPQGNDYINGFVLAYSSPCPARSIMPAQTYTLCNGSGKTLTVNSSTLNTTYNWYATDSTLLTANTVSVIVTPTVSTNYIAYVDSAGCKHTEHFSVAVLQNPKFDSLSIANVICGNAANTGGVSVIGAKGGTAPYTYNSGGAVQTSNSLGGLVVGNYTATVTDKNGCTYQKPFTIKQVNIASANFTYAPTTICVNEPVAFINKSTNTNLQTWSFALQDSTTQNPIHVFTDTGTYQITLIAWRNQRQCSDTVTKTLVVKECPSDSINLTVPNIFTPNADGINDEWQVLVYNINYTVTNYACIIYDRWGIKVFETNNISGVWNGRTTSGMPSSAGAYYYIIKLTATNSKGVSEQKDFKGYVELVR